MIKLDLDFFTQDVDLVAKNLLGKQFNFYNHKVIVCETESYGEKDPASVSYMGKITKRSKLMFEEAGIMLSYLTYGMHYCFNIVTGRKGEGSAVLIRSIYSDPLKLYINGPGRTCKFLNITTEHNGVSVVSNPFIFFSDIGKKVSFISTPRIGISKGTELLKRYVVVKEGSVPIKLN